MAFSANDVVFRKSKFVTNTATNGGRKGSVQVVSGTRHSLIPRTTRSERINGVTKKRKQFWCNENADDLSAYGVLIWMELTSNGGDHFYLREGSNLVTDIQGSLEDYEPLKLGTGVLKTAITAGDSSVTVTMEDSDYIWPNGDYIHISNKVKTGQTIDSAAKVGDSVQLITGTWYKITYQDSIDDPYGIVVGSDMVMTIDSNTDEEWLQIKINLTEDAVIGDGDGTDTPTLSALPVSSPCPGICRKKGVDSTEPDHPVVVTASVGSSPSMKARFNPDGTLDTANSDASTGELNMSTGAWVTQIQWDAVPETAGSPGGITVTFAENSFERSGNDYTIQLETGVTFDNSYSVGGSTDTYVGACLYSEEVKTSFDNWAESSSAGTFDESTYPPVLYNDGTEEQTWTITVGNANAFTCVGSDLGSVGSGVVGSDFYPVNPDTGEYYFFLDGDGWSGSWQSGDTIVFRTHPSALGMWIEQEVPASTSEEPNNYIALGWFAE